MGLGRVVPIALLAGGLACVAYAVATGGATAGVFVVFPFVIGTGPIALLGVVLFVLGLLTLAWALPAPAPPARPSRAPPGAPSGSEVGGFALIGPVPIFFGSWRSVDRRVYWLAVAAGLGLLLLLFFVGAWLVG